jgi:hypothetical protein
MPDALKPSPSGGHMRDTSLADALSERYLAYAMSTITANAFSISLLSRNAHDGSPPRRIRSHMRPYMLRPPITASGIGAQMHNPASRHQ